MKQYRGKRKDNGEWVYGWYEFNPKDNTHWICFWQYCEHLDRKWIHRELEVLPETVGQSTGKFDDMKIWQGDICKAEYRCLICFDSEPHLLVGTIEQGDNGLWMFDYGHGAIPMDSEDLEIVEKLGNIHDTPELMEKE